MGSRGSKGRVDAKKYLLETVTGHTDSINCMVLSEDESVLVTGDDKEARLWDVDGGKGGPTEAMGSLKGHTSYVTSVDVSGVYVVTGSSDCTVKKWDMTTCECCFTYEGHKGKVMRVICTGEYIISSSSDKTAKVWIFDTSDIKPEAKQRCCVRTLEGHTMGVHPIIYIPARQSSKGGEEARKEEYEEDSEDDMNEVLNEELVVTGSADNTARLWAISTGSCLVTYRDHRAAITTMATDKEVRILFTGSADTTIHSYEIRTGRLLKEFRGHNYPVICMSVVNQLMYTGDTGGTAKCWVWRYGDNTCDYKGHNHTVTCIKFHQGIVYTGCGDGVVRAFDAKMGILRQAFKQEESEGAGGVVVNCLTVCGSKLYSGSHDGIMRVWDVSSWVDGGKNEKEKEA